MRLLEKILPGKCVVCFSRGGLHRYAGHFPWLRAEVCPACRSRRAEPLSLVLLWISVNGGPDACGDVASGWVTHGPQGYVGWDGIRALYAEEIDGMLSIIETELGPDYAEAMRTGRPARAH
jgi:hypothetical protein